MAKVAEIALNLITHLAQTGYLPNLHVPCGKLEPEDICDLESLEENMECLDIDDDDEQLMMEFYQTDFEYISFCEQLPTISTETKINGCMTRCFTHANTSLRYVQTLSVLSIVGELCIDSNGYVLDKPRIMSLRGVYYSLKHLFICQADCNSVVLDVGRILDLKRHEMGIVPVARGKIVGKFSFAFLSPPDTKGAINAPVVHDCMAWVDQGGLPISSLWTSVSANDIHMELQGNDVKLMLIVEKDGPFQKLCEERFFDQCPCIIVTGCGFPDIATRCFVSKVSAKFPSLQVIGLCDYNPYGAALLLTYKTIPKGVTRKDLGNEACTRLKYLGMRSIHVAELCFRMTCVSIDYSVHLQRFNIFDHRKLSALLDLSDINPLWKEELLKMRENTFKCELESLYALGSHALSERITESLLSCDFI